MNTVQNHPTTQNLKDTVSNGVVGDPISPIKARRFMLIDLICSDHLPDLHLPHLQCIAHLEQDLLQTMSEPKGPKPLQSSVIWRIRVLHPISPLLVASH